MSEHAPRVEFKGMPDVPELSARVALWSGLLEHRSCANDCRVLVERRGWLPGDPVHVEVRVAIMRSGQPAIVASESAGVPSGTDHQAARHARLIVDRVFGVVVEALTKASPP